MCCLQIMTKHTRVTNTQATAEDMARPPRSPDSPGSACPGSAFPHAELRVGRLEISVSGIMACIVSSLLFRIVTAIQPSHCTCLAVQYVEKI